jgi:trehalose 6-phosphate synthase
VPVWYVYGHLTPTELLAYYRAADVALVTPLRDGMNLVAKEYCAANVTEDGVLILSEFAGAAAQLRRGALLVNPYDIEGVADAIRVACAMEPSERRARMRRLRHAIRRHDVFWWVDAFLDAALSPEGAASMQQVPMLEMDTETLHAANDAVELPDNASESAPSRRPHANLLN